MIQRRMLKDIDRNVSTATPGCRPKTASWRQNESLPCPSPGQISPLTTVAIVKDVLHRLGMDSESWRPTNIKDLYLPSVFVRDSRLGSANLRTNSTALTPVNEKRTLSDIREILTNSMDGKCSVDDVKRENSDRAKSKISENRRVKEVHQKRSTRGQSKTNEQPVQRVRSEKEDLFTLPRNEFKTYTPLSKTNTKNLRKWTKTPRLLLVGDCTEDGASDTRIFDLLKEICCSELVLEKSKTKVDATNNGRERENCMTTEGQARNDYLRSRGKVTKSADLICRNSDRKTGEQSDCKGKRLQSEAERNGHHFLQVRKELIPRKNGDEDEIKTTKMPEFEEKVERFNEVSPLICGFNRRYPRVRISLKYLVNHLNHNRMVKKFYGLTDSRRLNVNFSPENVLQSGDTAANKKGRMQYKRIRWLAAATDAFELDKGNSASRCGTAKQ